MSSTSQFALVTGQDSPAPEPQPSVREPRHREFSRENEQPLHCPSQLSSGAPAWGPPSLAQKAGGDILWGANAIAVYLSELSDKPVIRRKVYYMAEKKHAPIGRCGDELIASKRTLKAHFDTITGASAEK